MAKKKAAKDLKVKADSPAIDKPSKKQPPKFTIDDGRLQPPEERGDLIAGITAATGMRDKDAAQALMLEAVRIGCITQDGMFKDTLLINSCLALMHDINPQNALEGMLTAQIVGTHKASMRMLNKSMLPDQTVFGVDANINRATKLQRTFLQQVEALQKLRGKGQQKMTVEHVHVHDGGQAVVGTVNHGGGAKSEE